MNLLKDCPSSYSHTQCVCVFSYAYQSDLKCVPLFLKFADDWRGCASGKELTCRCRRHKKQGFNPWARKILWRRARQSTAVFLPVDFHGQRSLVGSYDLQGCKESDTIEVTYHGEVDSFSNVKCLQDFILSNRRSGKGRLEIKMYPVPRVRRCDTRFTCRWSVTDGSFHKRALGLSYTHTTWKAGHSTSAQPHRETLPSRQGGV